MLDHGGCCGQRLAQKTNPPSDTVISQMGIKPPPQAEQWNHLFKKGQVL